MFDPAAARRQYEAVTEALVKSALDAHSWGCEPRGEYLFKCCPNQACVRARTAIAHAREDLPAALEALEEARGKLEVVKGECQEVGGKPLGHDEPQGYDSTYALAQRILGILSKEGKR